MKAAKRTNMKSRLQAFSLNKIKLLYFFFRFSTGSIIPFLPLFMFSIGFTPEQVGRLQAIRPIVTMIFAPFWGGLSDQTGRKKLILISTFLMSTICRLSCVLLKDDITLFAIALCFTSIFYAAVTSLLDSIVVSSLTSEERVNFGKLRLWGDIGNGVSSTLMMHVSSNEVYGFGPIFVVHGVAAATAAGFMLLYTPSDQYNDGSRKIQMMRNVDGKWNHGVIDWKRNILEVFSNAEIASILGAIAITGCSMSLLENFSYVNIKALYVSNGVEDRMGREISVYRVFYTTGGVLSWFWSGKLQKRLGPNGVIITSICCLPLMFLLYAGIGDGLDGKTKAGFAVAETIRSGVFAAVWSSATIRLNNICPSHMTALLQAIMDASYRGIGSTVGCYLGGIICSRIGMAKTFTLVAKCFVSLLCTLEAFFFFRQRRKIK